MRDKLILGALVQLKFPNSEVVQWHLVTRNDFVGFPPHVFNIATKELVWLHHWTCKHCNHKPKIVGFIAPEMTSMVISDAIETLIKNTPLKEI